MYTYIHIYIHIGYMCMYYICIMLPGLSGCATEAPLVVVHLQLGARPQRSRTLVRELRAARPPQCLQLGCCVTPTEKEVYNFLGLIVILIGAHDQKSMPLDSLGKVPALMLPLIRASLFARLDLQSVQHSSP